MEEGKRRVDKRKEIVDERERVNEGGKKERKRKRGKKSKAKGMEKRKVDERRDKRRE